MLHYASAMRNEQILILGENDSYPENIKVMIEKEGFSRVITVYGINDLETLLKTQPFSLVTIIRHKIESADWDRLSGIRSINPDLPVIFIVGESDTESIVETIRRGAYDMFVTPFDEHRFLIAVIRAIEKKMLTDALNNAAAGLNTRQLMRPEAFSHIVTQDTVMLNIFRYLEAVAGSGNPRLITGETGTGKELIARAIYLLSGRETFVAVNIAGLDDTVFSDTLFGHTKGAFTGADTARDGLLMRAKDGVIFLDEIGDLSDISQIKLLRLIQDGTYYQIGSDTLSSVKAMLILATNRNLESLVESGSFRKDLFYRISTHNVHLPALRERLGDIQLLVPHFVSKAALAFKKGMPHITAELITLLENYNYPGNIRELESMVSDAVARHKHGQLSLIAFQEKIKGRMTVNYADEISKLPIGEIFSHFPTLKEWEDHLVDLAIQKASGNQRFAAQLLGISRQALNKRILNRSKHTANDGQ